MKISAFKPYPTKDFYMVSLEVSEGHGLTLSAREGTEASPGHFLTCSVHDLTLAELEAMHKQLGEEIAKAIQER